MASKAKKSSVMRARQWFLTYPQCPLPKEQVLRLLEPLGLKHYVIAEEKHKDGSPHIHAYVKLEEKIRFKENYFDLIDLGETYHGHYESVRNYDSVVAYCTKEENYIANVDIKARKEHRSKLTPNDFAKDPIDLLEEGKISFMQLNNFLKNQDTWKMLMNKRKPPPEKMPEKRRHQWVYGESNTGKTSYLRSMMDPQSETYQEGGWFQIPYNNDWKGYAGEKNLYCDEFKGQLTIQQLNLICDGGAKMNTKGGTTQLDWECKVWICSNFSIGSCYKNTDKDLLMCLYNRFEETEFLFKPDFGKKDDE